MEYTREDVIQAANILKEYCNEMSDKNCEGCPFNPPCEWCYIYGFPYNWNLPKISSDKTVNRIRENAIKSIETIATMCKEAGDDCEGCPFRNDREIGVPHDSRVCIFKGQSPLDWVDVETLRCSDKESETKIIPFDLSTEEDRNILIGKRIEKGDSSYWDESMIIGYHNQYAIACFYEDGNITLGEFSGAVLFDNYVFVETGLPVGKEVK